MIMSYKSISSNTINRQQTGGIIMTELSRFQKDVEVAATALEMRAENEDAKEEAIHLYRKFGSTKQEPLRLAVALRGYFLEHRWKKKIPSRWLLLTLLGSIAVFTLLGQMDAIQKGQPAGIFYGYIRGEYADSEN